MEVFAELFIMEDAARNDIILVRIQSAVMRKWKGRGSRSRNVADERLLTVVKL